MISPWRRVRGRSPIALIISPLFLPAIIQFKQEALSLFNLGYLSLVERSQAEELFWGCCKQISNMLEGVGDLPDELASLSQTMASTYYINLSIFRSIPDSWAIDQLFPIMPIHRLN